MTTCYPDRSRTAGAIAGYLHENSETEHTAADITRWWHEERNSDLPPTILKEMLSDLVTQGLIERREENGAVRYRSRRIPN